jgi:endonuclease-3
MNEKDIKTLFERFSKQNPHPKGELQYTNSFTLLVAVVLSAQATDKGVNKATAELFKSIQTPQQMLALGEGKLKEYIKSIGFYNTKAKNIIKLCQILVKEHKGAVPDNREDLEKLPGVGRKTANVVLNIAFNQPTLAVDTHVFRVSNRTSLAPGKTPQEVEKKLLAVVPAAYLHHAHHWLILHGRYICKAIKPQCKECIIQDLCVYPHKNL